MKAVVYQKFMKIVALHAFLKDLYEQFQKLHVDRPSHVSWLPEKTRMVSRQLVYIHFVCNNWSTAVVHKLCRMAALLLNPDFPKAPCVKSYEVHFAK